MGNTFKPNESERVRKRQEQGKEETQESHLFWKKESRPEGILDQEDHNLQSQIDDKDESHQGIWLKSNDVVWANEDI